MDYSGVNRFFLKRVIAAFGACSPNYLPIHKHHKVESWGKKVVHSYQRIY